MNPGRLIIGLLLIAGVSLSACSKTESDTLVLNDSGVEASRLEDRFGNGFGEKFRADPNSEPEDVKENDVAPVSLNTEPVPVE